MQISFPNHAKVRRAYQTGDRFSVYSWAGGAVPTASISILGFIVIVCDLCMGHEDGTIVILSQSHFYGRDVEEYAIPTTENPTAPPSCLYDREKYLDQEFISVVSAPHSIFHPRLSEHPCPECSSKYLAISKFSFRHYPKGMCGRRGLDGMLLLLLSL